MTKLQKFLLVLILALGIFLRFYRLPQNVIFHGELGDDYLAIKNFIAGRQIPLLGPATSHPWLSFGPLYYWLFAPVLVLGDYNPVIPAYFMAFLSIVIIFINFITVKKLFDEKIAFISSFLLTISPAFISLAREARFFSLIPLFFYPFWYFLVKRRYFLSGLFFGVMLNFHFSPIIFLPGIFVTMFTPKGGTFRGMKRFACGGLVFNVPFLIYNLTHGFEMLKSFAIWIPYRIFGFFGLVPKNTVSFDVLIKNFYSLYVFLGRSMVIGPEILTIAVCLSLFVFFILETRRLIREKKINLPVFSLILFFFFGVLGIFIHGDPPSHYYLPLYPIPVLFVSILLSRLLRRRRIPAKGGQARLLRLFRLRLKPVCLGPATRLGFIMAILFSLAFIDFKFYFSDRWFYLPQDRVAGNYVPYGLQLEAASAISKDAGYGSFGLARVGYYDQFEGNFSQNYQYLLWRMGNEPSAGCEPLYTIYEKDYRESPDGKIIFSEGGIVVTRK